MKDKRNRSAGWDGKFAGKTFLTNREGSDALRIPRPNPVYKNIIRTLGVKSIWSENNEIAIAIILILHQKWIIYERTIWV